MPPGRRRFAPARIWMCRRPRPSAPPSRCGTSWASLSVCVRSKSVKVLLIPLGSHGDVHPFVGLGMELARRGHAVTVITNPYFQPLIERARLPFIPLGTAEEFREVLTNPAIWQPVEGLKLLLQYMMTVMRPLYELIVANHAPGEMVVVNSPMGLGARLAHEKLGVPLATVHLAPFSLRSVKGPLVLPNMRLPGWTPTFLKRLAFWCGDRFVIGPQPAAVTKLISRFLEARFPGYWKWSSD